MASGFGMKTYMKGAAILTIAALLVKVLSAIYRVPFQNMVGDEGFYIYQQVYPFISVFVVWTSAGFAVAISKLLADEDSKLNHQGALNKQQILKTIFSYLTILSILFFAILFFGANVLANLMGDAELAPILKTGSFIVLVMPALAIIKGDFQSTGNLTPIAYASVFEQFVRVCIILFGTWLIMRSSGSVYKAGHMAITGTMLAEYIAFIMLFIYYRKASQPKSVVKVVKYKRWPIIKEVTLLSISVSMSSLLLLCYQLIDSFTIYNALLSTGMLEQSAKEMKGVYDRGQPLVQMGVVIASSLALAIVPLVAHMSKKATGRGAKPFIQLTYRASILFATAATLGLILVMPYINQTLFETDKLTAVLILYVLQIIPLSIVLTFTAILQGYSKLKWPAVILICGIILKLLVNIVFVKYFGVGAAALANNVGLFFTAIALMLYLRTVLNIKLASAKFYKNMLIACLSMTIAVISWTQVLTVIIGQTNSRMTVAIICLSAVAIGAFVMMTSVAKLRVLNEKEWFLLPFGRRMASYQLWLNRKK